jgi:hypothetical protein
MRPRRMLEEVNWHDSLGKIKKTPKLYIAQEREGFRIYILCSVSPRVSIPAESALGAFCMCTKVVMRQGRRASERAAFYFHIRCVAASVCNIFPQRAAPHAICERASRLHFLINRDAVTHSQSIACRWNSQRDALPDLKSPQKGHSPNCYVCVTFLT